MRDDMIFRANPYLSGLQLAAPAADRTIFDVFAGVQHAAASRSATNDGAGGSGSGG